MTEKELLEFLIDEGFLNNINHIEPIHPRHGTCCTCQECGYSYDDCVCDNNRKLEKLNILLGREIGDDQSARIEFTGLELKTLALLILSEAQKFKDKTEAKNLIIKIYGKIIEKIKNREILK